MRPSSSGMVDVLTTVSGIFGSASVSPGLHKSKTRTLHTNRPYCKGRMLYTAHQIVFVFQKTAASLLQEGHITQELYTLTTTMCDKA